MFSSSGFIDRGDIDELVCNMLRSELLKRYAQSNKRSRDPRHARCERAGDR